MENCILTMNWQQVKTLSRKATIDSWELIEEAPTKEAKLILISAE